MQLFGLIGYPLTHSFSKAYFTDKFAALGLTDHLYEAFPLEHIDSFPKLIATHPDLIGLNVTIPYKEKVIPYLDTLSVEAEAIGAVNTICFKSTGLSGHNTDWIGFRNALEPHLSALEENPSALILGTGGASKAVGYALLHLGIPFIVVSRKRRTTGMTYAELSSEIMDRSKLIINTTPLGMSPFEDACPDLDYNSIGKNHLLFDLVYNPDQTLFLRKGKERGATIVNGRSMLQIQAEESWKLWQKNSAGFSY